MALIGKPITSYINALELHIFSIDKGFGKLEWKKK